MKKTILIIVTIILSLTIGIIIFSDHISMYFAKNKPDNIIYFYPEFSSLINSHDFKPKHLLCFYSTNNGLEIKKLYKR